MIRLKPSILRAFAVLLAAGYSPTARCQEFAENEMTVVSRKLASIVLGRVTVENRPLSEVLAAVEKSVKEAGAAIDFVVDLKPTLEPPLVSCSLVKENAETVIEFVCRCAGYEWTISNGKVRVFTSDYHRARHLRGRELPERRALRSLHLKGVDLKNQTAEAIFLSLGSLTKNEDVRRALPELRGKTFLFLPSDRDYKRPEISISFDDCTLDDALELLTIRLPDFQWTADHNAIKGYYR